MNNLIVIVLVAFALIDVTIGSLTENDYPPKFKEDRKKFKGPCLAKSGTNEKAIRNMDRGNFVDDPALKAYIACIFQISGALTSNGKIDIEYIQTIAPVKWHGKLGSVISDCFNKNKDESNLTDRLYTTVKCMYDYNPELFFFP